MIRGHFVRAQLRAMGRDRAQQRALQFEPKRPEQLGTYAGNNEIVVDGKRYPFRDTQNINPAVGAVLTVRNVGRRAVVIMAPSEGTEIR